MIKTRTWITIIALLLLFCIGATFWLNDRSPSGSVANIYVDGVCVHSVDLAQIDEPMTYIVDNTHGINVIEIEAGRIRVKEADCPDQVCVRAGWLKDSASPIVCLPHRLTIQLEKDAQTQTIDSVSK